MKEPVVSAVIVESSLSFRQALKGLFHSRFPAVELADAANGKKAMELVERFLPNLILMDIRLPGDHAFELTQKIKARYPKAVVVIFSSYDLPEYRERALLHGADYFIGKDSPVEDYFTLIESILSN
jgi:two-component system response regulator YesN